MTKGTPSMGKRNKIVHIRCRRCGRHSYHIRKKKCSACGYPRSTLKNENWKWKTVTRSKRKKMKINHMKVKTARMGIKKKR
jgi:large subunit ribosomal protein L37e